MTSTDTSRNQELSALAIRLLSHASVHGDQHLAEVERDLVQMNALLDEAIKKLCASFMAIHGVAEQQQALLDGVLAAGSADSGAVARFESLRGELNNHVAAAVTGLQFQDMTSQLIGRMSLHLTGLRDVFGALDVHRSVPPDSGADALLSVLNALHERVSARFSELEAVVRSTVNQRHMESGDIDLF